MAVISVQYLDKLPLSWLDWPLSLATCTRGCSHMTTTESISCQCSSFLSLHIVSWLHLWTVPPTLHRKYRSRRYADLTCLWWHELMFGLSCINAICLRPDNFTPCCWNNFRLNCKLIASLVKLWSGYCSDHAAGLMEMMVSLLSHLVNNVSIVNCWQQTETERISSDGEV